MTELIERLKSEKNHGIDVLSDIKKRKINYICEIISANYSELIKFFYRKSDKKIFEEELEDIYKGVQEAIFSINYYNQAPKNEICYQGELNKLKSPFSGVKNPGVLLGYLNAERLGKKKFADGSWTLESTKRGNLWTFEPTKKGLITYEKFRELEKIKL